MATSGAQPGNQNATKAKRWTEAIRKALARYNRAAIEGDDPKPAVQAGEALDSIALTVVEAAIDGDWWAVAEIGNRLEGKPALQIDATLSGEIGTYAAQPIPVEQRDSDTLESSTGSAVNGNSAGHG